MAVGAGQPPPPQAVAAIPQSARPSNPYASQSSSALPGTEPSSSNGQPQRSNDQSNSHSNNRMPLLTGPSIVARLLQDDDGGNNAITSGSSATSNSCSEQAVKRNAEWMSTPSCRGLTKDIVTSPSATAAVREAVQSITTTVDSGPPTSDIDLTTASVRLVQLLASLFDVINDPSRLKAPLGSASSEANADGRSNGGAAAQAAAKTAPKLSGNEMVKLSQDLLTALAKFAAGGGNSDGSSSNGGVIAAQFAFESAFRSLHLLVKERSQFLASIWRGLCDVASAASKVTLSADSSGGGSGPASAAAVQSRQRYNSALSDAVSTLLEYVQEGTGQLSHFLHPTLAQSNPPPTLSELGTNAELAGRVRHLVKMFVFLLARVATMAPIWIKSTNNNSNGGMSPTSTTAVMSDLMNSVARLRGLSVQLELVAQRAKSRGEGEGETNNAAATAAAEKHVLGPIAKLGTKCDHLIVKSLFIGGGQKGGLQALLGVADHSLRMSSSTTGNDNVGESHQRIALGKLFLLRAALRKIRSATSTAAAGDASNDSDDAKNESSLSICEDLLFFTLPLCHSQIVPTENENESFGPSVLLDIVDLVADCTLRSELNRCDLASSSIGPAQVATTSCTDESHMMLVRWLVPSKNDCANGDAVCLNLHPLSREMIISIVHLHILRLCDLTSEAGRGTEAKQYESSPYVEMSARRLISLLCQVVIDPRTIAEARQSIAAVLLRLLGASADYSVTFARNEAVRSFVDALNRQTSTERGSDSTQHRHAGRKRRRKESNSAHNDIFYLARHWSAQELGAVGSILESVSEHVLFWEEINDALQKKIQKLCESMSLSAAEKRPGSIGLVAHCLAGGASCMKQLGIDPNKMHSQTVQLVSAILRAGDSKASSAVPSLLHFVQAFMNIQKQAYPCHELGILAASFRDVAQQSVEGSAAGNRHPVYILHAIASLLSQVGPSVSPDCPAEVLKSLSSTFYALFQSNEWPLVAETMSSLETFLTTMPKNHQKIVLHFLPLQFKPMLASRVQGSIYDLQNMETVQIEELRHSLTGTESSQTSVLSRARRRKVRTDLVIETNSTAVTLSKDGKVGAILIIPQGSSFSVDGVLSGASSFAPVGFVPNKLGVISHAVPARDGASCAFQIQDKI